jgi:hypothetical protein
VPRYEAHQSRSRERCASHRSAASYRRILWPYFNSENTYGNIGEVLKALGITQQNERGYNNKFGISINPPTVEKIENTNYLITNDQIESHASENHVSLLQSEYQIIPEEIDMIFIDIPPSFQESPAVVQVAAANQNKEVGLNKELYGSMGTCRAIPISLAQDNKPTSNNSLFVRDIAASYWILKYPEIAENAGGIDGIIPEIVDISLSSAIEQAKVTILQKPSHGTLSDDLSPSNPIYYMPNE